MIKELRPGFNAAVRFAVAADLSEEIVDVLSAFADGNLSEDQLRQIRDYSRRLRRSLEDMEEQVNTAIGQCMREDDFRWK